MAFVQIDDQQKPQVHVSYSSDDERPIWFLELRTGHICSIRTAKKARSTRVRRGRLVLRIFNTMPLREVSAMTSARINVSSGPA